MPQPPLSQERLRGGAGAPRIQVVEGAGELVVAGERRARRVSGRPEDGGAEDVRAEPGEVGVVEPRAAEDR